MTGILFAFAWSSSSLLWGPDPLADSFQSRGDPWPRHVIDSTLGGADGVRVADVNGDGLLDITSGGEGIGVSRVYIHPGYGLVRNPWPSVTVGPAPGAEDAVFSDLDGDGAIDVISSCQGGTQIRIHWAPSVAEEYLNSAAWETMILPASDGLMSWIYSLPLQIDGLNGIDVVSGGSSGGPVGWFEAPADPRSATDWTWHPMAPAQWVMSLLASDMDGDADQDVVVSDRNSCRWLENPGPGEAQKGTWAAHPIGPAGYTAMFMDLADLDQDGLTDAVVAVRNQSSFRFLRRLDASGLNWQDYVIPYPPDLGIPKAAAVADINADGRPDIVVTGVQATPPKSGVVWMSYITSPYDPTWEAHEISGEAGVKFDRLEIFDFDGDGDLDVTTTEEVTGLGVIWYENPGNPVPGPLWILR